MVRPNLPRYPRGPGWGHRIGRFLGQALFPLVFLALLWIAWSHGEERPETVALAPSVDNRASTSPPRPSAPPSPPAMDRSKPTAESSAEPSAGQGTDASKETDAAVEKSPRALEKSLVVPVAGVTPDDLRDSYTDPRSGGRTHLALDIMAPHGTPVLAVTDGVVQRLFSSAKGGLTIYQFGPDEVYCHYYAHLERYADGLKEGDVIRRGQVIGYVGSSGNASEDAPHLHFSISRLGPEKRWWKGEPINPYPILSRVDR